MNRKSVRVDAVPDFLNFSRIFTKLTKSLCKFMKMFERKWAPRKFKLLIEQTVVVKVCIASIEMEMFCPFDSHPILNIYKKTHNFTGAE